MGQEPIFRHVSSFSLFCRNSCHLNTFLALNHALKTSLDMVSSMHTLGIVNCALKFSILKASFVIPTNDFLVSTREWGQSASVWQMAGKWVFLSFQQVLVNGYEQHDSNKGMWAKTFCGDLAHRWRVRWTNGLLALGDAFKWKVCWEPWALIACYLLRRSMMGLELEAISSHVDQGNLKNSWRWTTFILWTFCSYIW